MPTYALLGATGATGSSVLRCLRSDPPPALTLNILVRSKTKLLKAFPKLEETATFAIRITEGSSTDAAALERCIAGSDAIINCVGTNDSRPNTSISYDSAAATIDCLKSLKSIESSTYPSPTVLQLRAGTLNPVFAKQMPTLVKLMLDFCLLYNYSDLQKAASLYARAAYENPGLLEYIYIDPGALHDADGLERTGHSLSSSGQLSPSIGYADLGAGICELVERRNEFKGRGVGISATGKVNMTWGANLSYLLSGLKNRFLHLLGVL